MILVLVIMVVVLLVAGSVVLYAAFPGRGRKVPGVPWLGDAFASVADAVPTLDEDGGAERSPDRASPTASR